MLAGSSAEGKVVLAAGAVKLGLGDIEATGWARSQGLGLILGLDWPTGDTLDLRLELGRDLVHVLWSDQDASPGVGLALEARLRALADRRSHDVGHVLGEQRDVVADTDEEPGSTEMVAELNESLCELVGVKQHELVVELEGDAVVRASDVLEGVKEDLMGILVVTDLLLLLRDVHGNLNSLSGVAEGSVELEGVLRFLGDVISFAHQVVNKLMGKGFDLGPGDHLDHVRDAGFTLLDVELESLVRLLSSLVVLASAAPLRFTFEELGNSEMLVDVSIVNLEDDLRVFVHLLMRLGNDESILTLAAKNEELDSFLLGSFAFAEVGDHQGALGQLRLRSEDLLCALRVVEVVQVESDDVLVVISLFVSFLSLAIILLSLLSFGNKDEDGR